MKEARETLTLNTLHDSTHTKTWRGNKGQSDTDWAPPDVRREDHVVWNANAFNVFFPNPQHSLTKSLWQNQDKINLHLSFCFTPSAAAATHLPPPLLLPPPRHLLNSEEWLSSGIGSEGTSGAQALLESRLRHAPHHLSIKTTSAARSALSGRGRPDRPRLGASVNIKTTLNFRCHMFWPALKLKTQLPYLSLGQETNNASKWMMGWWLKTTFLFWKVEEVLSKLGTITWIHFEKQEQTIRKTIVTIIYLSSYLFNYIIN